MTRNYQLSMQEGKFLTTVVPMTLEQELRKELYQSQTEEEKKQVYDQVILCNHLYLLNLCWNLTAGKIGFVNDDFVDDLYQEGMLYITEALARKRQNPEFKWCKPALLMYGIERFLSGKLSEMVKA